MIGFALDVLARLWPLPKPFGRLTRSAPVNAWETRRVVGTCGTCGGEVVYSHRARLASCAVGCSVIPAAMIRPPLTP